MLKADVSGKCSYKDNNFLFDKLKVLDAFVLSGKLDVKDRKFLLLAVPLAKESAPRVKPVIWGEAGLAIDNTNQALIYGDLSKLPQFEIETRAHHLKLGKLDILTEITLKGSLDEEQNLHGEVTTSGSIFNQKPIDELTGHFILTNRKLEIISLKIGEDIEMKGRMGLGGNYPVQLYLDIRNFDVHEVIKLINYHSPQAASGFLTGSI